MRTLFLFYFAFLFFNATAQTPFVEWGRNGICHNEDFANDVTVDNNGNSYVTGYFKDTLVFGSDILISAGERDIFFAKYNSSGSLQWARRIGGAGEDMPGSIMADDNGVYITGSIKDDVTVGTTLLTSFGERDALLVKCDENGDILWAKNYGSISDDFAFDLAHLSSGNIVLTGSFKDSIGIFGSQIASNIGGDDIFVLSVDPNGNTVWVRRFGSGSSEFGKSIAVDAADNIYISGRFSYTLNFSSIPLLSSNSSGFVVGNIFIAKLESNGNPVWAKQIGGTNSGSSIGGSVNPVEIDVTSSGKAIMMGYFHDCKLKLHTGALLGDGIESFTFLVEYEDNGDIAWTKLCRFNFSDNQGICVDNNDNLFVTNQIHTSTFIGTDTIHGAGNNTDIFVAKFAANGTYQWGHALVSPGSESSCGITTALDGSVFVVGACFAGTTVWGSDTLHTNGNFDFFLAKLSQNLNVDDQRPIVGSINVYPNPSAGDFYIDIRNGEFSEMVLYNSLGQKVHEQYISLFQKRILVDTKFLPSGIYFVELHGSGKIHEKIVLEK